MNEKSNIHIPMYAKIMILTPAPPLMEPLDCKTLSSSLIFHQEDLKHFISKSLFIGIVSEEGGLSTKIRQKKSAYL
jgi:hypothetical protein